jgi:hypothetical protein
MHQVDKGGMGESGGSLHRHAAYSQANLRLNNPSQCTACEKSNCSFGQWTLDDDAT